MLTWELFFHFRSMSGLDILFLLYYTSVHNTCSSGANRVQNQLSTALKTNTGIKQKGADGILIIRGFWIAYRQEIGKY